MTRKEQLKAIPYPANLGDTPMMRQCYANVIEILEHWPAFPKTREEGEKMKFSLPKRLQWAYERGDIYQSHVGYVQRKLREMEIDEEVEDNLS